MWNAIKEMLASKKALTMILSALVWVLGRFGLDLDVAEILPVVAPMWAYVLGQGLADIGKSKSQVEAAMVREVRADESKPSPT